MKLTRKLSELGRRLFRRVPMGFPAELEWNGRRLQAQCRDLSFGGAFVEIEVDLPLGSTVHLRLSRPYVLEDLHLEAEVRWHEVGGAGLRFLHPSARDLWVLSAVVD